MSMHINNVITHLLYKNESEELQLGLRSEPIDSKSPNGEALVVALHRFYGDKPKGFAEFNYQSDFQEQLEKFRLKEINFYEFSSWTVTRLKDELSKYPFADTGVLALVEYSHLATEYLIIALLPIENSIRLDDGLDINITDHVEFSKITIAARINITDFETKANDKYITYIKGRVGRAVSDFFLDCLSACVTLNTKQQNTVLLQAVEDFCSDSKLERDEKESCKKRIFEYCRDQKKNGEDVQLQELSHELPRNNEGHTFFDYTQEQGYELQESFPVDTATVRKLTKYVGAGGGINISFDSILLGERIFYDVETDTLTLKGIPPNLRYQLQSRR
ncbi:nucleoid-associated protein [Vibrio vulnificus YJ016]|uniref:Nucleoid-associated protein VVA0877 n=1 Tax=Vibrio vulnificus (strain YJ016) TaxID=196600 RepID=NDPA2_VIBVY|nr:nucleoid-associated protein YejK [Vibrio vulnificus]P60056.1 RecName: Full=Nucleoid-associated protein VVA0877 [Vibrio vulnificus YJ016]BAC96903.1 nucleoid-associated protein [Vibrio vulnificus YJ016]